MSLPLETLTTEQKLGIRATLGLGTADSPAFAGATIGSGTFAVNGVSFGRGGGAVATNTAVGAGCLAVNSTGLECVAVGSTSLAANTTGSRNVALGTASLNKTTSGNDNCAGGVFALFNNVAGNENVAFGNRALIASTGATNTAIGHQSLTEINTGNLNFGAGWRAGRFIADGATANTASTSSCFIGANTRALAISQSNQIVIGHDAIGAGSNSATLGNDSVTLTSLKGNVVVHRTSDLTNFERIGMRWDVLDAKIGTSRGGTGGSRDLALETGGTERARILGTNGNLGLGTQSPTQRLDVVGSIKASQPIFFPNFTVAALQALTASAYTGAVAYCNDEAGGPTLVFCDGTNWRRVQDRAIISIPA